MFSLKKPTNREIELIYKEVILESYLGHYLEFHQSDVAREGLVHTLFKAREGESIKFFGETNEKRVDLFSFYHHKNIIGYLLTLKHNHQVEMLMGGVFSPFRQKGYGKALCTEFIKYYPNTQLFARCKPSSTHMMSLLEKTGFLFNTREPNGTVHYYYNQKT